MDINKLLSKMTIDEKIGQCVQLPGEYFGIHGEITGPLEGYELTEDQIFSSGSTLGISGKEDVKKLQKLYLEKSRLKIPLMFMADVIHGYETIFPIPLALSCSFEPKLAYESAKIAAFESYVSGLHVTFSPMVDIVRDARWGRVMESNGEDQRLSSDFAKAYVKGYQGNNFSEENTLVSCVKHFAAYGAPEAGREYNTSDMSERVLREFYLPSYHAALKASAQMVMTSFNVVNSVPSTVNKWLLTDVLRDEMNFEGVVISDWSSVQECIAHGVCEDIADAGVKALNAGCDIEMASPCYYAGIKEAIERGEIKEEILDRAVLRILKMKEDLGLFDNPYRGCEEDDSIILSSAHKEKALEASLNSIVLLRNENSILPLKNKLKIALVGPNVYELQLNGSWSWRGHEDNNVYLQDLLKEDFEITAVGERYNKQMLEDCDVVLYLGGEKVYMSGEACSRSDITLPFNQEQEMQEIKTMGKKLIFINYSGRPVALDNIVPYTDAIVQAWFLGTMTNQAVSEVITGKFNPSAKLSMSFPKSVGQCPIYYNQLPTGRPYISGQGGYTSKYLDISNLPLYPFGYGLNYSDIRIKSAQVSKELTKQKNINIKVILENNNNIEGHEVIQVYFRDPVAKVSRPVKELVAYKKVKVKGEEKVEVEFSLNYDEFKYVDLENNLSLDKGKLLIMIGLNSQDVTSYEVDVN